MGITQDAKDTQASRMHVTQDVKDMQVPRASVINDAHDMQGMNVMHHFTPSHLIAASNYIVHTTVGSSTGVMLPVQLVLDAGSAYNVIRRHVFTPTGMHT